jgi:hypothetical protein
MTIIKNRFGVEINVETGEETIIPLPDIEVVEVVDETAVE